ncbi:hypothetical protein FPQ18DRAFT_401212 [Pyronema domesticum]|nr:hypothetical protein FPQ18DRAFT_401212 [Pyronema domesticum]
MREIADSESEGDFSSSPPPESPVKPPEDGFLLPAIPDPTPIEEARRRDEQLPLELEGMVEIPTQKDSQLSEAHGNLAKVGNNDSHNDGKVPDNGEEIQQAIAVAHAALIAPSSGDTVLVQTYPPGSNPSATQIWSHALTHPVNSTSEATSSADYLATIWESRAVSAVSSEVGVKDNNKKDSIGSGDSFASVDAAVVEQLPVPSVELPPSAVKKGEYEVFSEDAEPPSPSLPPPPQLSRIDKEKSTDSTHRKDMEIYELPGSDDVPPPAKRSKTTKPVESSDAAVTLDNQYKPKDTRQYPDPALPQPPKGHRDILDLCSSSPPRVKKRTVSSAILEAARKKRRALTNLAHPPDAEDPTDGNFSEKPERPTPKRTKTEILGTVETKRKKRKTLNDLTIPPVDHSSDSDFAGGPTPARKESKKAETHQEPLTNMAEETSTKSTRSNTDEAGLLPPLPKAKRKRDLTKELTDFLPLPDAKDAPTGRAAKERSRTEVDPYSVDEADFLAEFRIASEWRAAKGKKPGATQQPPPPEVYSDGELGSKGKKEKKKKEPVKKARGIMSLEDMLEPTPAELQLQQENAGTISRPHSALPSRQNSGYNSPADYHTPPLGAVAPVAPMMSFAPPPPPAEMSAEVQQMQPVQDSHFSLAEPLPAESRPSAESVVPPSEHSSIPAPLLPEAQAAPVPPPQEAQPPLPPPKQPAPPESPSRLAKRSYTKARFVADSDDEMDGPLSDVPAPAEVGKQPGKEKAVKEKKTLARKKTALPKDPEDEASTADTTAGSAGKRERGEPEGLDVVDELTAVDAPMVQQKKRSLSKKKVNEEAVVDDTAAPAGVMEAVEVPMVEAPKKKGRTSTKSKKAQEALRAQEAQEAADLAAAIEASLAVSAGTEASGAHVDEPSGDVEAAPVPVESVEVMEAVEVVEAPKKKGRTNTRTNTRIKKGEKAAAAEAIPDAPTGDPATEEVAAQETVTPAPKKRSNTGRGRKKKEPNPPSEPEPEPEIVKEATPEPEKTTPEQSFSAVRESTVSKKDKMDEEPSTPAPDSPSKKKAAKPTHSPIKRSAKVPFRVGLSKRARIEPLLTIRRPTKPA